MFQGPGPGLSWPCQSSSGFGWWPKQVPFCYCVAGLPGSSPNSRTGFASVPATFGFYKRKGEEGSAAPKPRARPAKPAPTKDCRIVDDNHDNRRQSTKTLRTFPESWAESKLENGTLVGVQIIPERPESIAPAQRVVLSYSGFGPTWVPSCSIAPSPSLPFLGFFPRQLSSHGQEHGCGKNKKQHLAR